MRVDRTTDGLITDNDNSLLFFELKTCSGDAFAQNIGYFVAKNHEKMPNGTLPTCLSPSLLLSHYGRTMTLSIACLTKSGIQVKLLGEFTFQSLEDSGMDLMRFLQGLKNALMSLRSYYHFPRHIEDLRFFFSVPNPEASNESLSLTRIHKTSAWLGYSETQKKHYIVKLCKNKRYGSDAHVALYGLYSEDQKAAPKLLNRYDDLVFGYSAVVMEYMEDYMMVQEFLKVNQEFANSIVKRFEEIVADFHALGFVHGDLRPNNLLVHERSKNCLVVDFDWAGKEDEPDTRYPLAMNTVNIKWHSDVCDGKLIKKEHDVYQLGELRKCYCHDE